MTCGNEEMTFYRAWRIVSVWENEPKLKEMTGTHPWDQWVSETARQNRMGFSITSSLEVARYGYLLHRFFAERKKIRRKVIFNFVFKPVIFLTSLSTILVSWLSSGKHTAFLRIFLLFNSVTSAVTTYSVSVFKPTVHDLCNSSYWNIKFAQHLFHALRRFKRGQTGTRIPLLKLEDEDRLRIRQWKYL